MDKEKYCLIIENGNAYVLETETNNKMLLLRKEKIDEISFKVDIKKIELIKYNNDEVKLKLTILDNGPFSSEKEARKYKYYYVIYICSKDSFEDCKIKNDLLEYIDKFDTIFFRNITKIKE